MNVWLESILHLIFPELCTICSKAIKVSDKGLCFSCELGLELYEDNRVPHNAINKVFWGRVPLHRVNSLLYIEKGNKSQQLIHALKYKGKKKIADKLGTLLARDIQSSDYFEDLDFILPVPLHQRKLNLRGYNQAELISNALSEVLEIPVRADLLKRLNYQETQTRKGRTERWLNVSNSFKLHGSADILEGKHIMLVDDVLTTGATLEACAIPLLQIPEIKLSVATLAYAP